MALACSADRKRKTVWLVAAVMAAVIEMTGVGAGLQATSNPADSVRVAKFARITARRIVVSLPDRKLALLKNGQVAKIYRVAVGKTSTPSPAGEFKIVNRVANPTYYHKGQVIPAGNSNPVGSRWMGLSAKSYGIHGTNQPSSIGKAASTGCIRMNKRDLEELFALVDVGDAVEIRAERDEQIAAIFDGANEKAIAQTQPEPGMDGGQ
jgi:hypothetical protein